MVVLVPKSGLQHLLKIHHHKQHYCTKCPQVFQSSEVTREMMCGQNDVSCELLAAHLLLRRVDSSYVYKEVSDSWQ